MFKGIAAGALALALAAALASCSASEPSQPSEVREPSEVSEVSEVSEPGEVAEELDKPFYRPDVNGLTVSEACEKVRAAGWRVDVIEDTEWEVKSHCGDSERIVVEASYYDDYGGESIVDFEFVE